MEGDGDESNPKCNPFGTRYLDDEARVWDHNAWDNVQWSEEMEEEAKQVVERQKLVKVDDERAQQLLASPAQQWDSFYEQHVDNFFKDRNWLLKEFQELDMQYYKGETPVRVLEVGCGVGNTTFPLKEWDYEKKMFLYSCDYSAVAVKVVKEHEKYDPATMKAFTWDITEPPVEDAPKPESLDFIVCVYVLSAIHPSKIANTVKHLVSLLKPGGMLMLKDYGRYDLTQLRFKKDRYIEENLYCRGDGTLVYFFEQNELDEILCRAGLEKVMNIVDKRLIVNRAKQNKKSLMKMTCQAYMFQSVFKSILAAPTLKELRNDSSFKKNPYMLHVLLYEFLAGRGLEGASPKLKTPILQYAKEIKDQEKLLEGEGRGIKSMREKEKQKKTLVIPRYVRINTLRWTREEAIQGLIDESWKLKELEEGDDLLQCIDQLKEDEIIIDPHVENLLIFPVTKNFHAYSLVSEKYLLLQDKASCLPAFLLNPEPGSDIFDCCAAPGNKTSHAAAIMENKGKIYSMDRDKTRLGTMSTLLEDCGVSCAQVMNGDFLRVDVNDEKYAKVRYAIVDPPCSGSGMIKRMDEFCEEGVDSERLSKLKNLQSMILKHAMKFPNLERVVYSTCSTHEEENEQVVEETLNDSYVRENFRLCTDLLPNWTTRGLSTYEDGPHCLRADPKATRSNGFFVAVFERI
ncbi:unnamed protein product [Auanema sp. JU1783]|nr:unnamed protein product [Auanema sp. JU1783]